MDEGDGTHADDYEYWRHVSPVATNAPLNTMVWMRYQSGSRNGGSSAKVRISASGEPGRRSRRWPSRLHHTTRIPNAEAAHASHAFDDWKATCAGVTPSRSTAR